MKASDGKVQQREPHPCGMLSWGALQLDANARYGRVTFTPCCRFTYPGGQRVPQVEEELCRGEVAEHGAWRGTRTERCGLAAAVPSPPGRPNPRTHARRPSPPGRALTAAPPPLARGLSSPRHAAGRGQGPGLGRAASLRGAFPDLASTVAEVGKRWPYAPRRAGRLPVPRGSRAPARLRSAPLGSAGPEARGLRAALCSGGVRPQTRPSAARPAPCREPRPPRVALR